MRPNELREGGHRREISTRRARMGKRSPDESELSIGEIARHVGVTMSSIAKVVARLEEAE